MNVPREVTVGEGGQGTHPREMRIFFGCLRINSLIGIVILC